MQPTQSTETVLLMFSIIIPAHNEERYIADTLEHLSRLNYPKNRYEVIVIENGSTDHTYEKARAFENENTHAWSIPGKGVSAARNFALTKLNPKSDWVVSLDADTLLKSDFLLHLNDFLAAHSVRHFVVGTTEITPLSNGWIAKFWFFVYNLGHQLTKTSMSIQLFKTSLFSYVHLRFPEHLEMGEDLELIAKALKIGKFFYFPTKDVLTSVRRFEQEGWIKVFMHWNFVALLPGRIQKHFTYKVVR
ncbi:MAG TPA: glycosyltransferase family A protein [Candidatus Paceibacterota bacterium]